MSLLIDALRQAEQARREPLGNTTEPVAAETEAPLRLEPLVTQESIPASKAEPATAQRKAPTPSLEEQRAAARQVFEVKNDPKNRFPLALAMFALVSLLAGLAYLWWAMQPHSQITNRGFAAPQQAERIPPENARAEQPVPSPEISQPVEQPPIVAKRTKPTPTLTPSPSSTPEPNQAVLSIESGRPALNLRRSRPADTAELSPLKQAYEAYAAGEFAQAYRLYHEVLRIDPRNSDALTGLGMLSLRAGFQNEAKRYFREALVTDPKNPTARSQLLSMIGDADPTNTESILQTQIAEQPEAPALHFALGSLYARSGRWKEAQQAFFQAYTLDGKNPDVLYNLAVSLEHLHQGKLARQFYEQAVTAAQGNTPGFDPTLAAKRAQQLATESASN